MCDSEAIFSASRLSNLDLNPTPRDPGIRSRLAPGHYTIRLVVSDMDVGSARLLSGILARLRVPGGRNSGGAVVN